MKYDTNMITDECTCSDAITRHGGSYDFGGAGRFCEHFLSEICHGIPCPDCGSEIEFIPAYNHQPIVPTYRCTNEECQFSKPNAPIDAKLILALYREWGHSGELEEREEDKGDG